MVANSRNDKDDNDAIKVSQIPNKSWYQFRCDIFLMLNCNYFLHLLFLTVILYNFTFYIFDE